MLYASITVPPPGVFFQHLHSQHAYEVQVSNLTKSVANLEESLRREEDEKHNILQDLAAVRDLCTKLEITKDALQRQHTAKTLDHEKVCFSQEGIIHKSE